MLPHQTNWHGDKYQTHAIAQGNNKRSCIYVAKYNSCLPIFACCIPALAVHGDQTPTAHATNGAPDARPPLWELLFDTQPPASSSFDRPSASPASKQTMASTPDFAWKKDEERRICREPKGDNELVLSRRLFLVNVCCRTANRWLFC